MAERIDFQVDGENVVVDPQPLGELSVGWLADLEHVADGQVDQVAEVLLEVDPAVDQPVIEQQYPPALTQHFGLGPPLGEQRERPVRIDFPIAVRLPMGLQQAGPWHVTPGNGVPFVILAGGRGKGGSHELAIALAVTLALISTLALPFMADLIVPGPDRPYVSPSVLFGLVAFQFVPLVLGMVAAAIAPATVPKLSRFAKPVTLLALVALLAILVPTIAKSAAAVFGSLGILAAVLIVGASLAVGWLLGGPSREHRTTLAIGTALKNPGLAMAIAATAFAQTATVAAAIVIYFVVQATMAAIFGATIPKRSAG